MKKKFSNFKKYKKNVCLSLFISGVIAFNIFGISKATDESASSESETTIETTFTTEEIDKIIDDLQLSGSIDNILEKLDEIIQRAQLSGNSALQEYATAMKESYQLSSELDTVNTLIAAMKEKNSSIKAVDEEITKILNVETITSDLKGVVSDETLLILESLDSDTLKLLQETFAELENLLDLNNISSLTIQQRSLADVIVLNEIIEEDIVVDDKLELAKNTLSVAINILQSYQKDLYPLDEYPTLMEGTERFLKSAKKASSIMPEQVVFLGGYFSINHSPIIYDNNILFAVDDLYQYIDASIEYMYNNATMVISSPGKILEIVAGSNVAYLNDKPYNMAVPILSFEDNIYMSVEFFAEANDISYRYVEDNNFLIMYENVNQLQNSSVPNELNKV